MKKIVAIVMMLAILVIPVVSLVQPAEAVNVWGGCQGGSTGDVCGNHGDDFAKIMKNVINTILYIVGIIAVISIILGGINYITSNGDASKIASAKNTIMYSVVGLIVAIMSFAIVNFVVTNVK